MGRFPAKLHFQRRIDEARTATYNWQMKTTVDIDEGVLRAAEVRARQQGRPLAALVEEALRMTVNAAPSHQAPTTPQEAGEGLEDNDPFFAALDEIRNAGRQPAAHREVHIE
jgi:hypothetical protein